MCECKETLKPLHVINPAHVLLPKSEGELSKSLAIIDATFMTAAHYVRAQLFRICGISDLICLCVHRAQPTCRLLDCGENSWSAVRGSEVKTPQVPRSAEAFRGVKLHNLALR